MPAVPADFVTFAITTNRSPAILNLGMYGYWRLGISSRNCAVSSPVFDRVPMELGCDVLTLGGFTSFLHFLGP